MPRIELSELPTRGKTELVQVLIPLKSLAVEDTAPEVQKMLTPFGTVSMLAKTNTLVHPGHRRQHQPDLPDDPGGRGHERQGDILTHVCKYKRAEEVADNLKTLLTDKTTEVVGGPADAALRRPALRCARYGGGYGGAVGPGGGSRGRAAAAAA